MQIDLKEFEFYEEENDGFRYMLTVVDHFSGFPWAFPLRSKTAEEVAYHLVQLFLVIGPPRILHSDNGGEFVNQIFDHISKIFFFKPAHGKAYNPREQVCYFIYFITFYNYFTVFYCILLYFTIYSYAHYLLFYY